MNEQNGVINDVWRGVPSWVRAVFLLGAPTVAAGWLIYLMSGAIVGDLREIRVQMSAHTMASATLLEKVSEDRVRQEAKMDTLIRIAQTQCVNQATDAIQRRDCVIAGR